MIPIPPKLTDDRFNPSSNHWRMAPGLFKERVTRQQLRDVLLHSADPIIRGTLYKWSSRHIGAGVYELFAEERELRNDK